MNEYYLQHGFDGIYLYEDESELDNLPPEIRKKALKCFTIDNNNCVRCNNDKDYKIEYESNKKYELGVVGDGYVFRYKSRYFEDYNRDEVVYQGIIIDGARDSNNNLIEYTYDEAIQLLKQNKKMARINWIRGKYLVWVGSEHIVDVDKFKICKEAARIFVGGYIGYIDLDKRILVHYNPDDYNECKNEECKWVEVVVRYRPMI